MRRYARARYIGVNRRRRIGRIALLCALCVGTLALLLQLGNVFHDRLAAAAPYLALPDVAQLVAPQAEPSVEMVSFQPKAGRAGLLCAPDSSVYADSTSIRAACEVAAQLYDGISVTVSGADGLRFSLSAAENEAELPGEDALSVLTQAADAQGLTVCAVWQLPDEIPGCDSETCAAAQRLAELGVDEILFTGLTDASLHDRDLAAMTALADAIKTSNTAVQIGFALEADVFADAASAPQLEMLAMQVDFVAVDFGAPPEEADAAEFALESVGALYGSIAYYPLRVLLRGSETELAAQLETLREAGYTAVQQIQ